jgi:hypothetical protein
VLAASAPAADRAVPYSKRLMIATDLRRRGILPMPASEPNSSSKRFSSSHWSSTRGSTGYAARIPPARRLRSASECSVVTLTYAMSCSARSHARRTLVCKSNADARVKDAATMLLGSTPRSNKETIRSSIVKLLPVPGPAIRRTWSFLSVAAARWAGPASAICSGRMPTPVRRYP